MRALLSLSRRAIDARPTIVRELDMRFLSAVSKQK